MKCRRFICKAISLKGRLYVVGGLNATGIESTLECFDPCTSKWHELAEMPTIAGAIEVSEAGGQIMVFGGTDLKGAPQPEVQRYDPLKNRWSTLANIGDDEGALESAALVGPAENLLAVCTKSSMQETEMVVQHYDDLKGCMKGSSWHLPAHRGRLRVVMATNAE